MMLRLRPSEQKASVESIPEFVTFIYLLWSSDRTYTVERSGRQVAQSRRLHVVCRERRCQPEVEENEVHD